MSREIKFRAWDEIQKYMAYQGTPDLETIQSFMHHFGDKKLLQFTGAKDHQGKEIYENDVVKINEVQRRYIVKFHNGCFKLFHTDPKLNDMLWGTIERVSELLWSLEVVGNIYENPELLS